MKDKYKINRKRALWGNRLWKKKKASKNNLSLITSER